MGVINFGNEPGLKSKISACGPSVRSRQRERCGHKKGVACGARETVANLARPMAPAVSRAPWVSLSLVQV